MSKFLIVLLLLGFFILAIAASLLYFAEYYPAVKDSLRREQQVIYPTYQKMAHYSQEYHLDPRVILGVLLVLLMVRNHISNQGKDKSRTPVMTFYMILIGGLTCLIVATIYLWSGDTINVLNLFTIHRGPREEFLASVIHIAVSATAGYLLFALGFQLYFLTFYARKVKSR